MGLFDRLLKKEARGPAGLPGGLRVYSIGDIHGRVDLLAELHDRINADAVNYEGVKRVVYLGDAIDRGEESRQVIEHLLSEPLPGFEAVYLMGNHEFAALTFMDDPESIAGWLTWGGREMLYSYGIKCGLSPSPEELNRLSGELKMTMPPEHVALLENGELSHRAGGYYFVHAGIRPGVPLEDQRFEDQLYIREPFISSTRNHGAVIVHGHTISEQVQFLPNRIGIDTGAYYTGVLSCLVLEGEEQRLIQTGAAS